MHQAHNDLLAGFEMAAPATVSKKGFAEHIGVSPGRVSQLIDAGLPVEPNGRISTQKGVEWVAANIDSNRRRASLPGSVSATPTSARAMRDHAEARIAEMKAEKLAGNLLDRRSALRAIENRARMERDSWLAWCNRAAPALALATGADIQTVLAALEPSVREHLASLASQPIEKLSA